ncbi:MAG: Rab family GTPase [Salibacteraceae bacterium]
MIKKKICILGAFAVGKTSLVEKYVKSIFSDKYHTTIGVKTDQKDLVVEGKEVRLIIWDINGEDDYQHVKPSYLMGLSGYLLVVDGTRKETLKVAFDLNKLVTKTVGKKEFILMINKFDLKESWELTKSDEEQLDQLGWKIVKTSAKSGENVNQTFNELATSII